MRTHTENTRKSSHLLHAMTGSVSMKPHLENRRAHHERNWSKELRNYVAQLHEGDLMPWNTRKRADTCTDDIY